MHILKLYLHFYQSYLLHVYLCIIVRSKQQYMSGNSYQPVRNKDPSPAYSTSTKDYNPLNPNIATIQNYKMTDDEYFHSLQNYSPLCYTGKGSPLFLTNKSWYLSLGCIAVMDALFLLVIFMFLQNAKTGTKPMSQADVRKFTIINLVTMGILNITYFLTQFLNPGIRNLSTISEQEYQKYGQFYCASCNGDRTGKMEHCRQCGVCIENLDHHCGFFSKCIGGCQTVAFYAFLVSVFVGFFALIITMTSTIGL